MSESNTTSVCRGVAAVINNIHVGGFAQISMHLSHLSVKLFKSVRSVTSVKAYNTADCVI